MIFLNEYPILLFDIQTFTVLFLFWRSNAHTKYCCPFIDMLMCWNVPATCCDTPANCSHHFLIIRGTHTYTHSHIHTQASTHTYTHRHIHIHILIYIHMHIIRFLTHEFVYSYSYRHLLLTWAETAWLSKELSQPHVTLSWHVNNLHASLSSRNTNYFLTYGITILNLGYRYLGMWISVDKIMIHLWTVAIVFWVTYDTHTHTS